MNKVLTWGKRRGFVPESCYPLVGEEGECPDDHPFGPVGHEFGLPGALDVPELLLSRLPFLQRGELMQLRSGQLRFERTVLAVEGQHFLVSLLA